MATDWDSVARLGALERRIQHVRREIPAAERNALEAAQSRADSVAALFGESVSSPIPGEDDLSYRKRLAAKFQQHSRLRDSRLDYLDRASFDAIEETIYADARAVGTSPANVPPGTLKAIEERDRTGRVITRFVGDIGAFMAPFVHNGYSGRFRTP